MNLCLFSTILLLLLIGLMTYPVEAVEPAADPAAAGSIAGLVTNQAGEPLANIEVRIEQLEYDWQRVRRVTTDADGHYSVLLLGPGIYRVNFYDPQQIYFEQYYDSTDDELAAKQIILTGNQVTNINASLTPSGWISGLISSTNGLSIRYESVTLYSRQADQWQEEDNAYISTAHHYSFRRLQPGVYRVCGNVNIDSVVPYNGDTVAVEMPIDFGKDPGGIRPASSQDYTIAECYANIGTDLEDATDLVIGVGTQLTHIDIVVNEGTETGNVMGRVTADTGQPLAGIAAWLVKNEGSYWRYWIGGYTNAAGQFSLSSDTPATYTLHFVDPTGRYVAEYLGHQATPTLAETVFISPTVTRTGECCIEACGHYHGSAHAFGHGDPPVWWHNRLSTTKW